MGEQQMYVDCELTLFTVERESHTISVLVCLCVSVGVTVCTFLSVCVRV